MNVLIMVAIGMNKQSYEFMFLILTRDNLYKQPYCIYYCKLNISLYEQGKRMVLTQVMSKAYKDFLILCTTFIRILRHLPCFVKLAYLSELFENGIMKC